MVVREVEGLPGAEMSVMLNPGRSRLTGSQGGEKDDHWRADLISMACPCKERMDPRG